MGPMPATDDVSVAGTPKWLISPVSPSVRLLSADGSRSFAAMAQSQVDASSQECLAPSAAEGEDEDE
eukprot:scaffold220784_cov32-Tisochrysis_lutea.AAC.12